MAYRYEIVHDDDYEIDGATGWGEPLDSEYAAETRQKFESGEWDVYGTIVSHECPTCGAWHEADALWGSIDDAGAIGVYDTIAEIPNEYLRTVALDLTVQS